MKRPELITAHQARQRLAVASVLAKRADVCTCPACQFLRACASGDEGTGRSIAHEEPDLDEEPSP